VVLEVGIYVLFEAFSYRCRPQFSIYIALKLLHFLLDLFVNENYSHLIALPYLEQTNQPKGVTPWNISTLSATTAQTQTQLSPLRFA
jgi:hypothetical protein